VSEAFVVGAGGHAKVVISTLRALGVAVAGVLDDDPAITGHSVLGAPVLGVTDLLQLDRRPRAVIAIGDNRLRKQMALANPHVEWLSLVHPAACVDPTVDVAPGSVVMAGAVVQPDSVLGPHCIVNTGARIDHDCAIGAYAHVAPGATLAGGVRAGEGTLLGAGCTVLPRVEIGCWTTVGGGAVVVTAVGSHAVVKGVPAR
jgi:sugar O-acyltransferase (sialic acid O-acetyltransferase NeuD family)